MFLVKDHDLREIKSHSMGIIVWSLNSNLKLQKMSVEFKPPVSCNQDHHLAGSTVQLLMRIQESKMNTDIGNMELFVSW